MAVAVLDIIMVVKEQVVLVLEIMVVLEPMAELAEQPAPIVVVVAVEECQQPHSSVALVVLELL